ncbi:MAG TPA: hypothetical protein VFV52_11990 [Bacilli bacterium]|nr:hypothetical protein [Bacilli bacterium]
MDYPEYITAIQTIAQEYMPNETFLTSDKANELADRLLQLDLLNPNEGKKGHHQTVLVYRENRQWIPVTIHWSTNEQGRIHYVRIHTNKYINEYGEQ